MDKVVDALYKKIIVLLAIAGGSWMYGVKFLEKKYDILSYFLFFIFLFISVIIIKNYVDMNKIIKRMKKDLNE